jgi:hypothetical protein
MLSATLTAKLQRWYLASQDHNLVQQQQVKKKDNARNMEQSLTCLCLDTEQSNLGIWQKKTGRQAEANWLRKVEFGSCNSSSPFIKPEPSTDSCMSEEDKFASEMIEELLGHNSGHLELMSPSMSDSSCSSTSCLTAFS